MLRVLVQELVAGGLAAGGQEQAETEAEQQALHVGLLALRAWRELACGGSEKRSGPGSVRGGLVRGLFPGLLSGPWSDWRRRSSLRLAFSSCFLALAVLLTLLVGIVGALPKRRLSLVQGWGPEGREQGDPPAAACAGSLRGSGSMSSAFKPTGEMLRVTDLHAFDIMYFVQLCHY